MMSNYAEAADCGLDATSLIVAKDRAIVPRGATRGTFIYLTLSLSLYIYIYIQATSATSPSTAPGSAVLLHMFIICVSYLFILYVSGGTGLPALLLAVLRALTLLLRVALSMSMGSLLAHALLVDIGSATSSPSESGSKSTSLRWKLEVLPLPWPLTCTRHGGMGVGSHGGGSMVMF
jgi:hypothetical protein